MYADFVMALHQNDPMIYCAFHSNSLAVAPFDTCNASRMLVWMDKENTSVRLWFTNNHLHIYTGRERERWESKKTQTKTHFEEKYCFTKCFRLAIVAWLPACLWKSQYSTMPDNHESLICQLVGRSMSIKKHHLSERTEKINFAICVHAQHHTCLSLRRHRPNKTATQALSILNFFEFSW